MQKRRAEDGGKNEPADPPPIPLYLVLKACPEMRDYAPDGLRHWHDLVATASFVRPMLGISADAWNDAMATMGAEVAATTLAGILQRASEIHSPGGYLRALTDKAKTGAFSPGPMIMSLLRAEDHGQA